MNSDRNICEMYHRMFYRKCQGKVIAIIKRADDVEEKWVVAPEGVTFTKEEIGEQIRFQEQYFDSEIIVNI